MSFHPFFKIHCNITLPSMSRFSECVPSFEILHQNLVPVPISPQTCISPTLTFLYFIKIIVFGDEYETRGSSLRSFTQSPFTSRLLNPNVLLVALLSETLRRCYSLLVRERLPEPQKTGKILFPYILIGMFSDNELQDKPFWGEIQQALPMKV